MDIVNPKMEFNYTSSWDWELSSIPQCEGITNRTESITRAVATIHKTGRSFIKSIPKCYCIQSLSGIGIHSIPQDDGIKNTI